MAEWRPKPGGQTLFMQDFDHRFIFLEGGWGSGKSWCGARKLLWLHLHNAVDEKGKPTGVLSAIIAPTYANAKDFCIPEFLSACEEVGIEVVWKSSAKEFVFPHRPIAPVMVRTADAADRITGWQVGAFWGDEAARWKRDRDNPKNDALTQIQGRLRSPKARIRIGFFTYTNEGDATAVYEMARSGREDVALYRAKTRDNDTVEEFCKSLEATLTPDLIEQYLEGGAANLRGQKLYGWFDPARNVSADVRLIENVPLDISIDFNINPGMHALLGQHHEDRDLFDVRHEFHAPSMSVRGLIDAFGRWIGDQPVGFTWPVLRIFGDATGSNRWAGSGESNYDVLEEGLQRLGVRYEFYVPRSNPFVEDRIQAYNVALHDMQGGTHWRCHPACEQLITDLGGMKRDKDGKIDKRDETLSHASDAEGYRVWYLRPIKRPEAATSPGVYITA